jgi:putative oxidoreductase
MQFNWLSRYQPQMLAVLRIVTALLFLEHGMMKLFHFPEAQMPGPLPPLLIIAATIELVAGVLIALGLFTRLAAFVAAGEMAVAYFMGHFPKSFWPGINGGDAAILFCFVFLYIAAAGPGAWSLDALMFRRRMGARD